MQFKTLKACMYSFILLCPVLVFSQVNQPEEKEFIPEGQKGAQVFKHARVLNDQTEILEVISMSAPTITASNLVDGTAASYNHKLRIAYTIQLAGGKGGYQLVFYGEDEKISYAVNAEGGATIIYMPLVIHEYFKSKMDQALTARKKVQLKINVLTSGLREAIWVL